VAIGGSVIGHQSSQELGDSVRAGASLHQGQKLFDILVTKHG